MRLNLDAKTKAQQLVKEYLENNASSALAEKINNGTVIEKDGKTLKNKKTLDGFMEYASDKVRKLAEKGANSACVEDEVVFGWAGLFTTLKRTASKVRSLMKTARNTRNSPAPQQRLRR